MNIVELILKALSGDTLSQLSSVVGESPEGVQKALAAIVPTLLSGIGGLASKPQGAEKLWSSLKSVDDRVSEDLGGILKGGGAGELTKKGTNILEDLLGKQSLAALIVPLAKFLAGNTALVTKLLPLVAPFLLSTLSKQVKSGGLDVAGLLKLLMSQKGNIASAMPKGLADGLAGVQGLGDLTSFASSAVSAGNKAVNAGTQAAAETTNWLVPGLIAAALAAAGLWYLTSVKPAGKPDAATAAKEAEETARRMAETMKNAAVKTMEMGEAGVEKAKEMVEEGVEKVKEAMDPVKALTQNFTGYFDALGGELDGISDEDTAKAAVPKLEKFATQFDDLTGLFNKLPEAARGGFSTLLEGGQKTLTEKTEKVLGIPGVGDLLKPFLEGILQKLAALLKG